MTLHFKSAKYYLKKGADPHHSFNNTELDRYSFKNSLNSNRTIFAYSIIRGQLDMVKNFLEEGYKFNSSTRKFFMKYTLLEGVLGEPTSSSIDSDLIEKQSAIFKLLNDYNM